MRNMKFSLIYTRVKPSKTFWGGNRPNFCGHPDFLLSCPNISDYPSIYLGNAKHHSKAKVLHISTSSQKMTVAFAHFFYPIPYCQNYMLNLSKPSRSALVLRTLGCAMAALALSHNVSPSPLDASKVWIFTLAKHQNSLQGNLNCARVTLLFPFLRKS